MEIINTILLIGTIQGFLLAILIYVKKGIIFHKLLSLIILIISTALLLAYFQNTVDLTKYPFLIKTNILFSLVFIPLLLIYLKKITGSFTKNKPIHFLLFIPLLIVFVYNIPFYFGDLNAKLDFYHNELNFMPSNAQKIEDVFIQLSITFFGFLAIRDVRLYKQKIDDFFSNHTQAKVHWLKFMAYSMFILSSLALLVAVSQLITVMTPNYLQYLTAIASTSIIYYIAYFLLLHPNALIEVSEKINKFVAPKDDNKLTINENSIDKNIYPDYKTKILDLLEIDKIYTNPEIAINDIAERIGVPVYLTSKIINKNLNTNFYNLINKYRLAQVKSDLLNSENKTIIEIAYQAGFNSKTTFYEVFKKNTGISPSDYIKQNKSALQSDKNI